ncbi:MAG: hypothetical protein RsTaC01_0901 [Candidatus Paraimprobicoccus trichonymphae]|uniref:Uncharacterized protein n=1 Tax=Candidatus Paraimprobicoccus trichonymphae TaxID=3033793 RepID=A0AA48KWF8_9FIRM|nr:MAG: hypothetical protein RsTaC01_0901 [Candidatus Paraimprobicoccus trichonymphae]
MANVEKIIDKVNATMSIEGMPLTIEDRHRIKEVLTDKISLEEMVKRLVLKHTVKVGG